ncbi:MAG: MFS transporter [Promethearchaeota archaeon]
MFVIIGSIGSILFYYLMLIAPSYLILLIYRFCQGSFTIMGLQLLVSLILDNSSSENRGKYLGIFLVLGMGLGLMLGGIIASFCVFFPYYFAIGANLIVLAISLFLIKEPLSLKKRPALKENLPIVKCEQHLIIPRIFNFVDCFHTSFIIFHIPLYVQIVLGLGPEVRGMILGIYALCFIILLSPVGKLSDKCGRYKFLIIGSLGFGINLCLIGYLGSFGLYTLAISFLVLGIFSGLRAAPNMALVSDFVEEKDNTMAMGFFTFIGNLGVILGPLVGGIVASYGDFILVFIIAGLIELISLGICLLYVAKFRDIIQAKDF